MKKLIALTVVQLAVDGKLAEITPGNPLVLTDEKQIAHLINAQAVREPTADEEKTLFNDDTVSADGKPVGVADLPKLTKAELISYAADKGITVDQNAVKADILATIEGHDELDDEAL